MSLSEHRTKFWSSPSWVHTNFSWLKNFQYPLDNYKVVKNFFSLKWQWSMQSESYFDISKCLVQVTTIFWGNESSLFLIFCEFSKNYLFFSSSSSFICLSKTNAITYQQLTREIILHLGEIRTHMLIDLTVIRMYVRIYRHFKFLE